MGEIYTVQRGDCLSAIAADFGFSDYRILYDHSDNAAFRALRPDPNLIFPGDKLVIPDKEGGSEQRSTEARHRFQLTVPSLFLRLRIWKNSREPIASKPYKITVDSIVIAGQTEADGKLEVRIPAGAKAAYLDAEGYRYQLNIAALNPIENAPDDGTSGIQARLKNLGYDPGPIDGIYGPLTTAAVRAFQFDNPPLAVDGIAGPMTCSALKDVHGY